jgi:hypothetical protein
MASKTQETIYDGFKALASGGSVAAALEHTATQIGALTAVAAGSSQSTGNAVVSAVSKVFTSGLGLVPLLSGLFGLFGGGGQESPPPLVKYAMPDKIYFEGADLGANILSSDYDQMGMPRAYGPASAAGTGGIATPATAASPQISVNVQAMDARSFLDHSGEIALAVRQAMLNLNSINDVVNDL